MTIPPIEPDALDAFWKPTEQAAHTLSIAISFKRIADAVERLANRVEAELDSDWPDAPRPGPDA